MYKYKIVASDLDGTLLNSQNAISEVNTRAIQTLDEKGIFFVPATGRTYAELPVELKQNEHIRYMIHSNGAVIYDKQSGNHIWNCLSRQLADQIFDMLHEYDVHVTVRSGGGLFVDAEKKKDTNEQYYHFHAAHTHVLEQYSTALENFNSWFHAAEHMEVFAVYFHNAEDMIPCRERLLALGGVRVASFPPSSLEIFSANAGKGNALHLLADTLGIDRADTIAVGDSDNDYTMIKAAGLGLGVSNACDSLKAICDDVVCSNDEHAIDYIAAHYFN